jgi:antirestriction protein
MEGGPQREQTSLDQQPLDCWPENEDPKLEPRIYVASLSDLNAGRQHGVWLDAAQEPEALHDEIANMLASSTEPGAEEWVVADHAGFNGLYGDWDDLAYVSKIANGIKEHGEAYAHWATLVSTDEELDQFDTRYLGRWPSRQAYAADVLGDLGLSEVIERAVPENLMPYVTIDADGFGRDLELGGEIAVVDGRSHVYVYSNI